MRLPLPTRAPYEIKAGKQEVGRATESGNLGIRKSKQLRRPFLVSWVPDSVRRKGLLRRRQTPDDNDIAFSHGEKPPS
jgi:hypothetical protein